MTSWCFAQSNAQFSVGDLRCIVTVPNAFEEKEISQGLLLTSKNGKAAFSLTVYPNPEGVNLASFQQSILSQMNVSDMKKVETKNVVQITGEKNHTQLLIYVAERDQAFVVLLGSGIDAKTANGILNSVRLLAEKKDEAAKEEKKP